jgi:predicted RNase H-like nuclease
MPFVAGVDGCKSGWLVLTLDTVTREITAQVFRAASDLFSQARCLDIVTIDIPTGLSDGAPRMCDLVARQLLGPRASSVFPAPVRQALPAATYLEACDLSEAACGKRLSQQAFAILPPIRDVDEQMRLLSDSQARIREVHPEVCFCAWAGGEPMSFSKKHPAGFAERLTLVEGTYPGAFADIRSGHSRGSVADDGIIDALAALWTAERILAGTATTIPAPPPTDRYGLRMEMVA